MNGRTLISVACCVIVAAACIVAAGRPSGSGPDPADNREALMDNPTFDRMLSPTGHSTPASDTQLQNATFGAGCFWGVEAVFRRIPGVVATAVGYAGGTTDRPTYKDVCTDRTGHAEVVRVQFDPDKVTYEELLNIFWDNHDPTTLNRQGPDVGTQYRSVIFYHNDSQRQAAEKSKADQQKQGKWGGRKIVTFIEPAPAFHLAEEYHQRYLEKRGESSCHTTP